MSGSRSGGVIGGLDRDVRGRLAAKYDPGREDAAKEWICTVLGEDPFPEGSSFIQSLKDGVILCKVLQKAKPGTRFKTSKMPFIQMENIETFLRGAKDIGCPDHDLFMTVDLYEEKNPTQVVDAIWSFSRHCAQAGLPFPILGPKLATPHQVTFTKEQMEAGKNIVNTFQYGYSGGANQSGISFGSRREIGGSYPARPSVRKTFSPPPTSEEAPESEKPYTSGPV
ncbi:MAG: calponin homology domain-containing protein [Piptocephalis tieghemiana]|nr:MAG: calponin homology domain-containing protein [Piptocephalis tieghemiana]